MHCIFPLSGSTGHGPKYTDYRRGGQPGDELVVGLLISHRGVWRTRACGTRRGNVRRRLCRRTLFRPLRRPAAPYLERMLGLSRRFSMAVTSAGTSRGGTSEPLAPSSTISATPGMVVDTMGLCIAAASMRTRGMPSWYDGRTTMSDMDNRQGMSLTCPAISTSPDSAHLSRSSLVTDSRLPGSLAPARTKNMSARLALIVRAAST